EWIVPGQDTPLNEIVIRYVPSGICGTRKLIWSSRTYHSESAGAGCRIRHRDLDGLERGIGRPLRSSTYSLGNTAADRASPVFLQYGWNCLRFGGHARPGGIVSRAKRLNRTWIARRRWTI